MSYFCVLNMPRSLYIYVLTYVIFLCIEYAQVPVYICTHLCHISVY